MEFFQNMGGQVIRSSSFTWIQLGELFGDTINTCSYADVRHSRWFELTHITEYFRSKFVVISLVE